MGSNLPLNSAESPYDYETRRGWEWENPALPPNASRQLRSNAGIYLDRLFRISSHSKDGFYQIDVTDEILRDKIANMMASISSPPAWIKEYRFHTQIDMEVVSDYAESSDEPQNEEVAPGVIRVNLGGDSEERREEEEIHRQLNEKCNQWNEENPPFPDWDPFG